MYSLEDASIQRAIRYYHKLQGTQQGGRNGCDPHIDERSAERERAYQSCENEGQRASLER